jgi:hypothetical protein
MDSVTQRQQAVFAAMVPEMTVSQTGNPRRYVSHPSGWRFVTATGGSGPIVLAAAPKHTLSAATHLVEGPAEARVRELLEMT